MEITWQGGNSITIKGDKATVKFNPSELKGADVFISSQEIEDHGDLKVFDWPGEYESVGVPVVNMRAWTKTKDDNDAKETLISKFEVDGVKFLHLGELGHNLTEEITDKIGDVDVMVVAVDGNLDFKKMQSIIEDIEPRAVMPVNFTSLEKFYKELSVKPVEAEKVYKLKGVSQFMEDKREYIILEKS